MTRTVSIADVAHAAGVSTRAIEKAVAKADTNGIALWRGARLEVREKPGERGGRRGVVYQVKVSSLPADLQARLKGLRSPFETPSKAVALTGDGRKWPWFEKVFKEALATVKGSRERGAALRKLEGLENFDWQGRTITLKRSTFARWIADYERQGAAGPARKQRADKGTRQVVISRKWDKLVSGRIDRKQMERIAEVIRLYVAGAIKNGERHKLVMLLASERLALMTRENGVNPPDASKLKSACKIPYAMYEAGLPMRKVHRHKRDRKASDDAQPRMRRTIKGLRPMEIVVMDVHHTNVLVRRENGTAATPKLLAFMDIATRRVWCELVFFEGRGGVRNTDVISAFVNMAQHPAFGLPETLYCDNGSEYLFADYLDDALKLNVRFGGTERESRVISALPYNAAAKPVEAWFGHFEQTYLARCQGYIGDDRMNPRQEKTGKLPQPFGTYEQFAPFFFQMLAASEAVPVGGQFGGKSPAEIFRYHVEEKRWAATVIDPHDLLSVFTKPVVKAVRAHSIEHGRRIWTCDELDQYMGDKVIARVPAWHGFNALRLETPEGREIGIALPNEEVLYTDPRGAKESARRKSTRNKALRALDLSVPVVDTTGELVEFANRQMPVTPNLPSGVVSINSYRKTPSGALAITPSGKPASESAEKREMRERAEAQDRLWKLREEAVRTRALGNE